MPNISKDKNDLESLIYGGNAPKPKQETGKDNVDSESDVLEQQLLFNFDYENDMKGFRKKASRTVLSMARHMLPEEILNEEYVKNKIEQDIDTLSELYWTRKSNTDIKLSIMNEISKGNTAPRMYDAYKSVNDSISDNNKQILATEDNLRKTYTDIKYEVQCKKAELESAKLAYEQIGIKGTKEKSALNTGKESEKRSLVFTGSKNLINFAKQQKKEAYMQQKAEDVEFENN